MRDESASSEISAADRDLEMALRGLAPAPPAIDRDGLMFRAGRAAARAEGRRRLWAWRAAAAVLAVALGLSPLAWPGPRVVERERLVYVPRDGAAVASPVAVDTTPGWPDEGAAPAVAPNASRYLSLREAVLRQGLGALPASPVVAPSPSKPLTYRELLDL